jgi:hypothetical protein
VRDFVFAFFAEIAPYWSLFGTFRELC